MSRADRIEDAMIARIDRADPRVAETRKAEKLAARWELLDSMRSAVSAARGSGSRDQQADRVKALISEAADAYVEILGPDGAHPYLASIGKDTGYRLTNARGSARDRANRLFADLEGGDA